MFALDTTVRIKRKRPQKLFVSSLSYLDKQRPAASKEIAYIGSQAVSITYQGLPTPVLFVLLHLFLIMRLPLLFVVKLFLK